MSDRAVLGGALAGLVGLPLIAGALLTGGLVLGVVVLSVVVALVIGMGYPPDDGSQDCLRCGAENDAEAAVCSVCHAQL
jgi:hypothetical protein